MISKSVEYSKLISSTMGKNEIVKLPSIKLENGSVYEGEWKNAMRYG